MNTSTLAWVVVMLYVEVGVEVGWREVDWAPAAMAHAVVFVCAAFTHCGAADVAAWRNHGLVQKPELVSPAHSCHTLGLRFLV